MERGPSQSQQEHDSTWRLEGLSLRIPRGKRVVNDVSDDVDLVVWLAELNHLVAVVGADGPADVITIAGAPMVMLLLREPLLTPA